MVEKLILGRHRTTVVLINGEAVVGLWAVTNQLVFHVPG